MPRKRMIESIEVSDRRGAVTPEVPAVPAPVPEEIPPAPPDEPAETEPDGSDRDE